MPTCEDDLVVDIADDEIEIGIVDADELLCETHLPDLCVGLSEPDPICGSLEDPEDEEIEVFIPVPGPPGPPGPAGQGTQDIFTATDGQTVFPLSHSNILSGSAIVAINGLLQRKTEYSVVVDTMTFNDGSGVVLGDIVTVSYLY